MSIRPPGPGDLRSRTFRAPTFRRPSAASIRLLVVALLTGLLLAGAVPAGSAAGNARAAREPRVVPPGSPSTPDDPRALRLLRRAVVAEHTVAYRGTQFVAVWSRSADSSELVDVANLPGRGTTFARRGGDGPTAFVDRSADARADGSEASGDHVENLDLLTGAYQVRLAAPGHSAGRTTEVVEAVRADGAVAARFWLDRRTGVLVRRELYDHDGSLVRANAFVDLDLGSATAPARPGGQPAQVTSSPAADDGPVVAAADYPRLAAQGWNCCESRLGSGPALRDVRRSDDGARLHLSYTDGLVSTSVFEQRGELDEAGMRGFTRRTTDAGDVYVRYGLSSYAVWAANGLVYTAVCDTPQGLDAVLAAFPRDRVTTTGPGLTQRLDRGAARMVSWLNPFD
ncbi:sigma-E factor negative regulatory protein RseB [Actinopolymorpha cephalotaxi]|uniref:Sigma-E factor negative regulatory protein RseB n=1 Tax=Actinopolymorpha cephalotaxi TaxID=504797 RepID=A0A1I2YXL1_9ACTN|nr:sigma-E factor regulatory protein RseB domain-containing protein [Actinopolymorpha cephalotaxi]NYH81758.1 sigma-E factor negative regulatory protein RseB [Actinopolymorpha cephalotaxi]SFH30363.1 sigma-E factor negative regulatory protein RseB [Actinopolymorpha cephalotaxi]